VLPVNVTAGRAVYKRGGASRPLRVCEMLPRDANTPGERREPWSPTGRG
jgi:hypothetical protein